MSLLVATFFSVLESMSCFFFSTGLDYYGIFPRIFSSTSYARIFFSGCLNSLRYLHKNHGRDRACDENDVSWPKIPRNDSDQDSNPDCSIRSVKYGFSVKTNSKLKIIEVTFQVKKNKPMDTRLSWERLVNETAICISERKILAKLLYAVELVTTKLFCLSDSEKDIKNTLAYGQKQIELSCSCNTEKGNFNEFLATISFLSYLLIELVKVLAAILTGT